MRYFKPNGRVRATQPKWHCRCDCGNEMQAIGRNLLTGNTESCGCLKRELQSAAWASKRSDMTGSRFGRLTVTGISKRKSPDGKIKWLCRCECGNTIDVTTHNLRNGNSGTCGSRECRTRPNAAERSLYNSYKCSDTARRIGFSISFDQFTEVTRLPCNYCGRAPFRKFSNSNGTKSILYSGIDRINSSKGYVIENIVPSCTACNRAKMDMSITEFIQWIYRAHAHISSNGFQQVLHSLKNPKVKVSRKKAKGAA